MALSRDIVIRLLGDSKDAEKAMKAAADAAEVTVAQYRKAEREMTRQQQAMDTAMRKQHAAMESAGRGAAVFGAVVAAGLGVATKAAIDWESAWAGVRKTVDGTPAEMNALEASLRKLATTLPATHAEIAGVAEAAGQLGIARGDIAEFTEVAVAMGVSTNLSAEDAAVGLARMSNIMGTSSKDVDRMGSALVALGNAGASTEGEILDMSLRIAAAGRQAGMSEGEVMGLANAMSSLGIEAEAGGTAISTVIKTIGNAVDAGGDDLDKFAAVAGTTSAAFAKAWRDDAAGALQTVIGGLARMQAQGENVNTVIADLGLDGIRTSDTLLRLAGNAEGLAASLATGNKAWADNNALMNEANQRYETTASRLQIARNQISDAAIDIGGLLLPVLASGAELIADFARGFADLPEPLKTTVTILGTLAATVGLVGGAALIAVPKIAAFRAVMHDLEGSSGAAQRGMGKLGIFMTGPWGAAIGVATFALGGLITWLGATNRASEEAKGYQEDLAAALRETGGVIDENIRAMAAQKAEDAEFADSSLLEWADKLGVELPTVTDALLGQKSAYDEIAAAIDVYAQAQLDAAIAAGNADTIDITWAEDLKARYRELTEGMGGAVAENERLKGATEETGAAAEGTAPQLGAAAEITAMLGDETDAAADAAERLADALDALNGPTLNINDANRDYQQTLADVAERLQGARDGADGYSLSLDITTEAGRKNMAALDDVAGSAMDVANAVFKADGDYAKFRGSLELARQDLFNQAKAFFATEEEAWSYVDSVLAIPAEANTDITAKNEAARIAIQNVQGWIDGLRGRDVEIRVRAAGRFIVNPQGGLQEFAEGGYTGHGGKYDPAGVVHRGEYVLTKEQTNRLGIDRIEAFANGGKLPGYATGGPVVPLSATFEDSHIRAAMESVTAAMKSATPKTVAGAPGGGGVGGSWQSLFAMVKAVFPQARVNSAYRPGDPGYHGRGKAVDLGWGSTPGGAGNKGLAAMDRWWYQNHGSRLAELIYTGAGDSTPDIKNGRPLNYGPATNAAHRNHVHVASYQSGTPYVPSNGLAYLHEGERVVPRGLNSAATYGSAAGARAGGVVVHVAAPSLEGMALTGRLEMGTDGMVTLVDGRISSALTTVIDRGRYSR